MSEAERRAWMRALGLGFVLVVGGSAGLMALANGASLLETGGLTAVGLVSGTGLVYYLSSLSSEFGSDPEYRRR
jgi:hypothetical protein